MIDIIQRDYGGDLNKYVAEVYEAQDPEKKLNFDIASIINSITYEDVITITASLSFELGSNDYNNNVYMIFPHAVSHQRILLSRYILTMKQPRPRTLRENGKRLAENENQDELIIRLGKARLKALGIDPLPQSAINDIRNEINAALNNLPSTLARVSNAPALNAFNEALKVTQREYKAPGQISIFDDQIKHRVDVWDGSESNSKNARKITITNAKENYIFGIEDYTEISKFDVEAQKLLLFYTENLIKAENENIVTFSIDEYNARVGRANKDRRNNRKILHGAADRLTNFKINLNGNSGFLNIFSGIIIGKVSQGDKEIGTPGMVTVIKNNVVDLVKSNDYTSYLPKFTFVYKGTTWMLATYIYSLLRIDSKSASDPGDDYKRELSLLKVAKACKLPDYETTNRTREYIIDPLEKTVAEFNKAERQNGGTVTLKIKLDKNKPPREALESGKLQIIVKDGLILESMREVKQKQIEHKEDHAAKKERREKRVDAAKGRELARLEQKEKGSKD